MEPSNKENIIITQEYKENKATGEIFYNIEYIMETIKTLDGIDLINYTAKLFREKYVELFSNIYKLWQKDFFIAMVEKALEIQNNGGMQKEVSETCKQPEAHKNEKKTIGGVFFTLIKKQPDKTQAFTAMMKEFNKDRSKRKKLYKKLEKLNII